MRGLGLTTEPKFAAPVEVHRQDATNRSDESGRRPCILIAEDYGAIAMMLYEDLSEAGFEVSGPFTSCSAALASLDRQAPDAAILDIELNDGPCVALARTLRDKGIPFLVLTGHNSDRSYDNVFSDAPWLAKPMSNDVLVNTARSLLQKSPLAEMSGWRAPRQRDSSSAPQCRTKALP
jgi:DNA-binding response OmpR family regulator